MQELHGVMSVWKMFADPSLKKEALFCDRIHVIGLEILLDTAAFEAQQGNSEAESFLADLDYLQARNILVHGETTELATVGDLLRSTLELYEDEVPSHRSGPTNDELDYLALRVTASELERKGLNSVALIDGAVPAEAVFAYHKKASVLRTATNDVLEVALTELPVPGDDSAWPDIFDFKAEMHDKQWAFRRFLNSLATRSLTRPEIHDEIDWFINEYQRAMRIHHIKASRTFFKACVIPAIEIIEDIAKFNWSKIAKSISVTNRKLELLEAEMKAPGRECAYIFDARQRFHGNNRC